MEVIWKINSIGIFKPRNHLFLGLEVKKAWTYEPGNKGDLRD